MPLTLRAAAALALLAAAIPVGAHAKDPAYVGTWASRPSQCKVGQDMEEAPLVMKTKRYDQHEAHCAFASVAKKGKGWAVKARCTIEGDVQTISMTLTVEGDRLTIADEHGSRTLQRCL